LGKKKDSWLNSTKKTLKIGGKTAQIDDKQLKDNDLKTIKKSKRRNINDEKDEGLAVT